MTSIKYNKISENKWGELFKVSLIQNNNFKPIEIILKNVNSIFGKETEYNKSYIKWCITKHDQDIIELLEKMLKDSFTDYNIESINSLIVRRESYPTMVKTKLPNNSHKTIKHKPGEIITFSDIKNKSCDVTLKVKVANIRSKQKISYNLEIVEIALLNNN